MNSRRRIAVLTTGRQDWGLLRPLCKQIAQNKEFDLLLLAGGMALSEKHGKIVSRIREQGFKIDACLEWAVEGSSTPDQAAKALSRVGTYLKNTNPESLVLLGDRFETAAAALAATLTRTPIVHLYGGEETQGAFDNALRHAITKLAHLHFVSHELYEKRLLQMGEAPETVHMVGSLAVDNIAEFLDGDGADVEKALGVELVPPVGLVTLHPTTLARDGENEIDAVVGAMERFQATYIVTLPNADPGNEPIREAFEALAGRSHNVHCFSALGEKLYLQMMRYCDFVLGNSSSGVIEAPMLRKPTVNIGDRQKGRLRFASILDAPAESSSVERALQFAMTVEHIESCRAMPPPFGDAGVATRILSQIANWDPGSSLRKTFHEQENTTNDEPQLMF